MKNLFSCACYLEKGAVFENRQSIKQKQNKLQFLVDEYYEPILHSPIHFELKYVHFDAELYYKFSNNF